MGSPRRQPRNRNKSAHSFNRGGKKSHVYNHAVMRGGWRL